MSSGIRLAADASPLISPRRPAGRTGLSDRRLPERQGSCFCFAPTATVKVGMPGVSVLGCEIKEEASAAGRRREIGRAHVCTPVTNAHLVCRLLLEKKKK